MVRPMFLNDTISKSIETEEDLERATGFTPQLGKLDAPTVAPRSQFENWKDPVLNCIERY